MCMLATQTRLILGRGKCAPLPVFISLYLVVLIFVGHFNRELDGTFVFGVMVVYGISQGIGYALSRVVVDYYWRDVQGKEPSTVQFYRGITVIPWDVKPLYGLLTDLLPFFGYHRRPYFILAGPYTEP